MENSAFEAFNPLDVKISAQADGAAHRALTREINNILSSYIGWFDPFCELVQNSMDAVESRAEMAKASGNTDYRQRVSISLDLDHNTLKVSDNGIGLNREQFNTFLAPNYSYKSDNGSSRGHKGVGATYLAYGFDYMRVSTKYPGFVAAGVITGARSWINSGGDSSKFPVVEPDVSEDCDDFKAFDRGVSITLRFNENSRPGDLNWLKADNAETWMRILALKTAVGAVSKQNDKLVSVTVTRKGKTTNSTLAEIGYQWLHYDRPRSMSIKKLEKDSLEHFLKHGDSKSMPSKYFKLDFIHESWDSSEFDSLFSDVFVEEHAEVISEHTPSIAMEYGYTAKFWSDANVNLGIRSNQDVYKPGIQLAANQMPQGDVLQVPLVRNIGRQNQVHFLIHFDNYTPDLGRKGFAKELVEFAKDAAKVITESRVSKFRKHMKANSGAARDLERSMKIDDWKDKMVKHEADFPLNLSSEFFFAPTKKISITSEPSREQDVIALFHELISGGVVRGIQTLATNELFTYDGLFRVSFELSPELYGYKQDSNPLGVSAAVLETMHGRTTKPKVLEYKFSLDGLIEDIQSQEKHLDEVDLCVAWNTGNLYESRYRISSVLIPENHDQRLYHGLTHVLEDIETGSRMCDLIILEDLVDVLVNSEAAIQRQREKYEDS